MRTHFRIHTTSQNAAIALAFCLALSSCAEQQPMTGSEIQEACRTQLEASASRSLCMALPSTSYEYYDGMGDFVFCDDSSADKLYAVARQAPTFKPDRNYCDDVQAAALNKQEAFFELISEQSMIKYCGDAWSRHSIHFNRTCRAD